MVRIEIGSSNGKAIVRGFALFALGPIKLLLFLAHIIGIVAACIGVVLLFPPIVDRSRFMANLARRLADTWSGVPVSSPYQPRPAVPTPGLDGFYRSLDGPRLFTTPRVPTFERRSRWVWRDSATWRDLAWLLLDPIVGGALAVLPAVLIGYGLSGVLVPLPWHGITGPEPIGIFVGIASLAIGWLIAPKMLHLHGVWTKILLGPPSEAAMVRSRAQRYWFGAGVLSTFRCLAVSVLSLVSVPIFVFCLLAFLLTGPLVAMQVLVWARWLPNVFRRFGREWSGLDLPKPYLSTPSALITVSSTYGPEQEQRPETSKWWATFSSRARSVGYEPATWRDLLWLGCQPLVGVLPMLLPAGMIGFGVWGLFLPAIEKLLDAQHSLWAGELFGSIWLTIIGGVILFLGGLAVAPGLLQLHGRWLQVLLQPTASSRLLVEREQLAARVERLTRTRTDAIDAQAAEVRRIERDLHDGTQARLVAMGMTLGAVEALIDKDPTAAKKLVTQLRGNSESALAELRNLIRGIYPPVLAERGLVEAIRALALDSPMNVQVIATMDGHAEAPVESAMYFAVAELITNATRHADADLIQIDLTHVDGVLRITVFDNGKGGADPDKGSGLTGIKRRLGTFDGKVTVDSPPGGPTAVTMEVPCVLSSPKTSIS